MVSVLNLYELPQRQCKEGKGFNAKNFLFAEFSFIKIMFISPCNHGDIISYLHAAVENTLPLLTV